jgi:hypothetical protein
MKLYAEANKLPDIRYNLQKVATAADKVVAQSFLVERRSLVFTLCLIGIPAHPSTSCGQSFHARKHVDTFDRSCSGAFPWRASGRFFFHLRLAHQTVVSIELPGKYNGDPRKDINVVWQHLPRICKGTWSLSKIVESDAEDPPRSHRRYGRGQERRGHAEGRSRAVNQFCVSPATLIWY